MGTLQGQRPLITIGRAGVKLVYPTPDKYDNPPEEPDIIVEKEVDESSPSTRFARWLRKHHYNGSGWFTGW